MKNKQKNRAALLILLLTGSIFACGGTPSRVDGEQVDQLSDGPTIGLLEERSRGYLEHMISIIESHSGDGEATVFRLGGWLEQNGPEIRETVTQIGVRVAGMTRQERIYYDEQFGTFFGRTTELWFATLERFRAEDPEAARSVDGLMLYFD